MNILKKVLTNNIVVGIIGILMIVFIASKFQNKSLAQNNSQSNEMFGYAWSDNIGWISLNCLNPGQSCDLLDPVTGKMNGYSVKLDPQNGNLVGYAWSDNIGWIQFGNLATFPPPGSGEFYGNAKLLNNTSLSGWVRAVSPLSSGINGWDGWISLSGSNYGVTKNSNGNLSGFAWGSDVVGWVDFQYATLNPPSETLSIITLPATNITKTSAVLNGQINVPVNDTNEYKISFYWGTDAGLSSQKLGTSTKTLASPSQAVSGIVNFNLPLNNLTENTTYYFMASAVETVSATGGGGAQAGGANPTPIFGEVLSFTTLGSIEPPCGPVLPCPSSSSLNVTLSATINPVSTLLPQTSLVWNSTTSSSLVSCFAFDGSPDWSGPQNNNQVSVPPGIQTVNVPNNPTTYKIQCFDSIGNGSNVASVSVGYAPLNRPFLSLISSDYIIEPGDPNPTLTWTGANLKANSCQAVTPIGWTSKTTTSGSEIVSTPTTYTLRCVGNDDIFISRSVTISDSANPICPNPLNPLCGEVPPKPKFEEQ